MLLANGLMISLADCTQNASGMLQTRHALERSAHQDCLHQFAQIALAGVLSTLHLQAASSCAQCTVTRIAAKELNAIGHSKELATIHAARNTLLTDLATLTTTANGIASTTCASTLAQSLQLLLDASQESLECACGRTETAR